MSPRPRGIIEDGGCYHVINRGNNKMTLFFKPDDFERFVYLMGKFKKKYPIFIYHYCLMPNHIHLIVKTIIGNQLSKFMQGLCQAYAYYYRKAYEFNGYLW